jgi:hypothetical protein
VAGTPGFVSPELLRGGDPTTGSDRWAAAALLLNAATGRQPFGAGAIEAVLARVLDGAADVDGLEHHVAEAFLEALATDPGRRSSLAQLAEAVWPSGRGGAGAEGADGAEEDLAPTRVARAPEIPGEPGSEPTEHLWTEPPVVDYRRWVAQAAPEAASPGAAPPLPDDAGPPLSPYPSPPRGAAGVTLGLWALLGAVALHAPWAAASVGAAALVAGRSVWMAVQALTMRRFRRGLRPTDRARVAVSLPWYLLRGLLGCVPALVVAAAVGLGVYFGAVDLAGWAEASAEFGALAVACGLALAWWGPSSSETRHGSRTVLRWLARTGAARAVATFALLAVAGVILALWPW